MSKTEMEDKILSFLYECWQTNHHKSVSTLYNQVDLSSKKLLEQVAEELENKDFIKDFGECLFSKITAKGIKEAENRGLIHPKNLKKSEKVRYEILQALYQLRMDEGINADLGFNELCEQYQIDESDCSRNLGFLREINFAEDCSSNSYKITEEGLKQFKVWQKQKFFNDEFERISKLDPQPRGRALQKLLAEVINFVGRPTDEGVRRSHEEIDITVEYNGNFYLIECKWEKKKTEASVVRELYGKLENRSEMRGVLGSVDIRIFSSDRSAHIYRKCEKRHFEFRRNGTCFMPFLRNSGIFSRFKL